VFTYVYSHYALRLLLQIFLVAASDIKTRDVPTVSSINLLLSQYCKASHFFANFYVWGFGGANCSLCPCCPMGKGRPWIYLILLIPLWYCVLHVWGPCPPYGNLKDTHFSKRFGYAFRHYNIVLPSNPVPFQIMIRY
jgi:hypothetical protein